MFDESEDGLLDDCIEMGNQKHDSINDERAHEIFFKYYKIRQQ